MAEPLQALVLDLVEWIAREPRSYREVMDAWRTSCPRLTIWEDAVDAGLVARAAAPDGAERIIVTQTGRDFLAASRRAL
jgi:hypothetical protein